MLVDTTIIAALIAGVCSIVVQVIVLRVNAKELYTELDKRSELADVKLEARLESQKAVTETKLDELTREVREHNNFALKIPAMEDKVDALGRSINRVHERIDDIQKQVNTLSGGK